MQGFLQFSAAVLLLLLLVVVLLHRCSPAPCPCCWYAMLRRQKVCFCVIMVQH
jgi:hypothetical protein